MMDYKMFKRLVEEQFLDYMPEKFKDYSIKIDTVSKTNRTLDALYLKAPESEKKESLPIFYVNDMYLEYEKSGDFREAMESSVDTWMESYKYMPDGIRDFNLSSIKERVFMVLINTEQNMELLGKIPHREFCDLSIIYRYAVEIKDRAVCSFVIDSHFAERAGMTEQQLYDAAFLNTKVLLPPSVRAMDEIIREMYESKGMPEELIGAIAGEIQAQGAMYVISNQQGCNGAVSMLYEDGLHALAEKIGTDMYILPSSIHEVIAVSALERELEELAEMVSEINQSEVAVEDRLSNQVYHYDRKLRRLELATDIRDKCLGGTQEEPQTAYGWEKSR
jgi:hypothetical protein